MNLQQFGDHETIPGTIGGFGWCSDRRGDPSYARRRSACRDTTLGVRARSTEGASCRPICQKRSCNPGIPDVGVTGSEPKL